MSKQLYLKQGLIFAGILILFVALLTMPHGASAADTLIPAKPDGAFGSIEDVISRIFNFVIAIAGVVFFVMFLVAGITYLASAGNEENTSKAKKQMVDSIVGLVLVLASWALASFVYNYLTKGTTGSGGSNTPTFPTGGGGTLPSPNNRTQPTSQTTQPTGGGLVTPVAPLPVPDQNLTPAPPATTTPATQETSQIPRNLL